MTCFSMCVFVCSYKCQGTVCSRVLVFGVEYVCIQDAQETPPPPSNIYANTHAPVLTHVHASPTRNVPPPPPPMLPLGHRTRRMWWCGVNVSGGENAWRPHTLLKRMDAPGWNWVRANVYMRLKGAAARRWLRLGRQLRTFRARATLLTTSFPKSAPAPVVATVLYSKSHSNPWPVVYHSWIHISIHPRRRGTEREREQENNSNEFSCVARVPLIMSKNDLCVMFPPPFAIRQHCNVMCGNVFSAWFFLSQHLFARNSLKPYASFTHLPDCRTFVFWTRVYGTTVFRYNNDLIVGRDYVRTFGTDDKIRPSTVRYSCTVEFP